MNGAETLVKTLLAGGLNVCFANPGTSEMHFVAALDSHPDMRCILCLFEGGATGAADGYYRIKREVAATLLHLSPGFANGFANLHNARKARSGVLTIVGDHAIWHLRHESPLKGDTQGIARSISHWVRQSTDAHSVAPDGAAALQATRTNGGQIATLILPANVAWEQAAALAATRPAPPQRHPVPQAIAQAARDLRTKGAALLIDGAALHGPLSHLAARIAAKTGCRLIAPYFVARFRRGQGAARIERIPYNADLAIAMLADVRTMVLCGADRPATFFAYPDKPSLPEPAGCHVIDLCPPDMDVAWTLHALAAELGAEDDAPTQPLALPPLPGGTLTLPNIGAVLAALLPDDAIVVDEAITSAAPMAEATQGARAHDWLCLMGGAIGNGLPLALGAAIAAPDRRVVALMGDGSAMYTLQALWTMARERTDVTILIFANRGYQILRLELANVGVTEVGRNAGAMFNVDDPLLDWVSLAKGHGVDATRVSDVAGFAAAFARSIAQSGPYLIELAC